MDEWQDGVHSQWGRAVGLPLPRDFSRLGVINRPLRRFACNMSGRREGQCRHAGSTFSLMNSALKLLRRAKNLTTGSGLVASQATPRRRMSADRECRRFDVSTWTAPEWKGVDVA